VLKKYRVKNQKFRVKKLNILWEEIGAKKSKI